MERSAACHQSPQARRLQEFGDHRRRVRELLEVVENQKQFPVTQVGRRRFDQRPVAALAQPQSFGHRRHDKGRIADSGQGHEAGAISERVDTVAGSLQGEPRLARSAGPGARDEAASVVEKERLQRSAFALAPHECRVLRWQIVMPRP